MLGINKIILIGRIKEVKRHYDSNRIFRYQIEGYPVILSKTKLPFNNPPNEPMVIKGVIASAFQCVTISCANCLYKQKSVHEKPYIWVHDASICENINCNKISIEGSIAGISLAWPESAYVVLSEGNRYYVHSSGYLACKDHIFLSDKQKIKVQGEYRFWLKQKETVCEHCGGRLIYLQGTHVIQAESSKIIID